jgi:hypothetical protein
MSHNGTLYSRCLMPRLGDVIMGAVQSFVDRIAAEHKRRQERLASRGWLPHAERRHAARVRRRDAVARAAETQMASMMGRLGLGDEGAAECGEAAVHQARFDAAEARRRRAARFVVDSEGGGVGCTPSLLSALAGLAPMDA